MQRQIRNTRQSYEIFAARPRPALCALALLAGSMAAGPTLAQTAAPTSDPLRGERRLLPLDDIMLFSWTQIDETTSFAAPTLDFLLTAGNNFTGVDQAQPAGAGDLTFLTFGTAAGNLFAAPRDTIAVSIADQLHLYLGNTAPVWSGTMPNPASDARTGLAGLIRPLMAMADVTGDGYAEIVVGTAGGGLQIATAVDPTDSTQGVRWGAQLAITPEISTLAGAALAAGDFDGDGLAEVALAFPAFVGGGLVADAFRVSIFDVDPATLSLTFAHSATTATAAYGVGSFPIRKVSLAAGDFDRDVSALGLPDDELVLTASGEDAQDTRFVIMTYNIAPDLQPSSEHSELHIPDCTGCGYMSTIVDSGRLDWTGALEQAVVGLNHLNIDEFLATQEFWILTFSGDDGLEFDVVAKQELAQDRLGDCVTDLQGLAIGNFDRQTPTAIPASLSIAVLRDYGLRNNVNRDKCSHTQQYHWLVDIWTVDPTSFAVSEGPKHTGAENTGRGNQFRTLLTGDYQGGSLWLGPPTIVPLEGLAEPEVVLQAPPMHMDLVPPVGSTSAELLNLSFGLPGFNTKFTTKEGTTTITSHQSRTSNSFAEKESLDRSSSFGVPGVASVSVDLKLASEQTQQDVVSRSATTITSTVDSFTAASDLDDLVWYTQQDLEIYIYPVLCPPVASDANPSDATKCGTTPLYVTFSVPQSQKLYSAVPGGTVEWYQPPHQVAQALSYPWSETQLEALFPSATLDPMTRSSSTLSTASPVQTTFEWSTSKDTTTSIGKTNTYSLDTSISISTDVNADIDIFSAGAKTKESFAFNYSRSIATLTTSETKVEGDLGFATNVPASLRAGSVLDYVYEFDVMVFGQEHPPCNPSEPSDVTCLYDNPTLGEEINTQGTLWAGYTIELPDEVDSNNWWVSPDTGYTTLPDVALNHPGRWVLDASQSSGDNCLLDTSSSAVLCYVQSAASLQPADIAENEFHRMKGFFVVPAASSSEGHFLEPQGPQTTVIGSDGQVWLQARVYNYSFLATGTNRLHVRFYAQEWNATRHVPLAGKPSVLIDEVVLDQCIPGHSAEGAAACSQGGDDNWLLVTTSEPFDPTAHGIDPGTSGTYVLFWVLIWLEDADGNLVAEVPGHGLTGLPGDLASLTAAGGLSQTYGNNLGWFPVPIFVCPSGLDCANVSIAGGSLADAAEDEVGEPQVRISRLQVSRRPVAVHERAPVRARLRAGEVSPRSVHVALYDGDPEADGRIFDVELVPYLRAEDTYLIRTSYRPDSCGPHNIVLVADPGGGAEPVSKAATVNVSADPRIELAALQSLFAAADLPRKQAQAVAKDLRQAARVLGRGEVMRGMAALEDLRRHARRSGAIPPIVEQIEARIDAFAACVADAGGALAYASRLR